MRKSTKLIPTEALGPRQVSDWPAARQRDSGSFGGSRVCRDLPLPLPGFPPENSVPAEISARAVVCSGLSGIFIISASGVSRVIKRASEEGSELVKRVRG